VFSRLNQAVLRHIDRKRGVPRIESIDSRPDGFAVTWRSPNDQPAQVAHHAWGDIRRVVAVLMPNLIGDDECLLVEVDGSTLQLTPEVPGFETFIYEGSNQLDDWRPATEWRLALVAGSPGEVVDVYGEGRA
jgi:hypothetical protein